METLEIGRAHVSKMRVFNNWRGQQQQHQHQQPIMAQQSLISEKDGMVSLDEGQQGASLKRLKEEEHTGSGGRESGSVVVVWKERWLWRQQDIHC